MAYKTLKTYVHNKQGLLFRFFLTINQYCRTTKLIILYFRELVFKAITKQMKSECAKCVLSIVLLTLYYKDCVLTAF